MSRPIGFRFKAVDLATAGLRYQLSSTPIFTPFIEVFFPSGNGGSVYIGDSTVTTSWIPRSANTTHRFSASEIGDVTTGDYFDLSKIYFIGATAGDDVIVQYLAAEG